MNLKESLDEVAANRQIEADMRYAEAESKFDYLFDNYRLDREYAMFILGHSSGDRLICNGDTLIKAQEEGYLFDEFRDDWIAKYTRGKA